MDSPVSSYDIVIVGAGIVGSAVAYFLSLANPNGKRIVLIDRSITSLRGSTGHAPGFVGQFNDSETLTRLAVDTVSEYLKVPGGFDATGGLEIASSQEAIDTLKARHQMARATNLPALLVTADQAARMAPELVKEEDISLAVHYPADGVANATIITSYYQNKAQENGVRIIESNVRQVMRSNKNVSGVDTDKGLIRGKTVVISTGVWAPDLLASCGHNIPIVPVGHPYMYGPERASSLNRQPWVRWPFHQVYARDHGSRLGLGTYNHQPVVTVPKDDALGNWNKMYDEVLEKARVWLPQGNQVTSISSINGIFALTPDNLPLVGEVGTVPGLYMAAAVWVTHAAGAAKFLVQMIEGQAADSQLTADLDPMRFQGEDANSLAEKALSSYNHIYKTIQNGIN